MSDLSAAVPVTYSDWEIGSFNTSNGSLYNNATSVPYIRRSTYVGVEYGIGRCEIEDGYYALIFAYNQSSYIGVYKTTGTFEKSATNMALISSFDFSRYPDYKFRITVRNSNSEGNVDPTDYENIVFYRATDDTLSIENKPADAKAVGNAFESIKSKMNCISNVSIKNDSYTLPTFAFQSGAFNSSGQEVTSDYSIRTALNYLYDKDGIDYIWCDDDDFFIGIRAWNLSTGGYAGFFTVNGSFATTGTQAQVSEFYLSDYPEYIFRFSLLNRTNTENEITVNDSAHLHFHGATKAINFFRGDITSFSTGVPKRFSPASTTRCITNFIHIKNGDRIIINPNGYSAYVVAFVPNEYNPTSIFYIPANEFQTEEFSFDFHYDCTIIVRAANIDTSADVNIEAIRAAIEIAIPKTDNNQTNPLYKKRLSVMGDSMSTFDGYIPNDADTYYPKGDVSAVNHMYWKILAEQTGMIIDTINAYGGTNVATKWQTHSYYRPSFIDESRLSNIGTPDVIVVFGGTNDFGGNPLGEYPTTEYTNLYEFRTAYAYLLNQLKSRYPSATIVCLSLLTNGGDYSATGTYPVKQKVIQQSLSEDKTTHYMYEFNNSIEDICRRYECLFCDISDCMNYYNLSAESYDGTHPLRSVHAKIANRIKSVLIGS